MKMTVVDFQPWHSIVLGGGEDTHDRMAMTARAHVAPALGPAVTLLADGAPVAAMGIAIQWTGVGEAWVVANGATRRHAKSLHHLTLWALEEAERRYGLRRISASIRADRPRYRAWAARLGFIYEGPLRAFGEDGADYVRFARTRLGD